MATYLLVRDRSVNLDSIRKFINKKKIREITSISELELAWKQITSDIYISGSKYDEELIKYINKAKLKRNITYITKSSGCARSLQSKISNIILLDKYSEMFPSYWSTKLTTIENMHKLSKSDKDSLCVLGDTSVYSEIRYNEDESGVYLSIVGLDRKQYLSEARQYIKDKKKELKSLIKEHGKTTRTKLKTDLCDETDTKADLSMDSYLQSNKYLTEEELKDLKLHMNDEDLVEVLACERGLISNEELIDIVRSYYDIDMLGKEVLPSYKIDFKNVNGMLKEKGIIEAKDADDNTVIIISYTERDKLVSEINSSINYDKMLFTTPQYIKGMIMNV